MSEKKRTDVPPRTMELDWEDLRFALALARHGSFVSLSAAAALLRQSAERRIHVDWPEPEVLPAPPLRALRATVGSGLPAAAS